MNKKGKRRVQVMVDMPFWLAFALIVSAFVVFFFMLARVANATTQVTICHNNGQSGNYTKNTVDWHAVDGEGNGDHNRSGHQDGKDIIPPGFWDFNGRNWDTEGQAIYRNDCVVPPVDVCNNLEDIQTTVPENYYQEEGACYPKTAVCGDEEALNFDDEVSSSEYVDNEVCEYKEEEPEEPEVPVRVETPLTEAGAPVCGDVAPAKIPNIFVPDGTQKGELEVRWIPTGGDKAHIFYGTEAGNPQHALLDTPNDGVEVIRDLASGEHYWFSVVNGSGCAWSPKSDWYDPVVR